MLEGVFDVHVVADARIAGRCTQLPLLPYAAGSCIEKRTSTPQWFIPRIGSVEP